MASINHELLVNGDFATGDLQGWTVDDPSYYTIVPYEPGKNSLVQHSAPPAQALVQTFTAHPGKHFMTVWHRATDEQGQPVDKVTVSAGLINYATSDGRLIVTPILLVSRYEWSKWTSELIIERGEPATDIRLSFQNIDNSARASLGASLNIEFEETPVALRGISAWRMDV